MCQKTPKDKSAQIAAQQERERQARITAGTGKINEIFTGFDDKYYDGITGAYKDHYQPLLDEQYGSARKRLELNPVGGSTESSAFAAQLGDLEKERQRQISDISSRSMAEAQNSRANVANNRQSLISQLGAGASVDTVAGLANEQAKTLTATPVYSQLGDLFSRFTANAANAAGSGLLSTNKTTQPLLFGTSGNSNNARVVGSF